MINKKSLIRWLFPKILSKGCTGSIPRSGSKGEKVNCYSIFINDNNGPFILVDNFKDDKIFILKWVDHQFQDKYSLDISDIDKYELEIHHYYGLYNLYYTNILNYAFRYITKFDCIKIFFFKRINSVTQFFFNKKKLITKKRLELLHIIVDIRLDTGQRVFNITDLMTRLYSLRWAIHPSADDQMNRLEYYLESLVSSGELKNENLGYALTGKAISTLEQYEEEERRHRATVNLQRLLVLLTFIIILVGLIQADVIKIPSIIDFTSD